MRRTKDEAEATRQSLLDAALIVFSRKGYEAARLEDVAEEAKVTRGAIYHHFGGKAQLFQTLTQERYAAANASLGEILVSNRAPLDRLRMLMVQVLELLASDAQYRAMQEIVLFRTPIAPELADGVTAKIEGTRALLEVLAELVREGIAGGSIRTQSDPFDVAVAALGLINGVTAMWLFDQAGFSLRNHAAGIVDAFIDGLRP